MLSVALIVNYSIIIGFMIFFVTVVSPVAISALDHETLAVFLRKIFPRMFLFGLLASLLGSLVLIYLQQIEIFTIALVICFGFGINLFLLTPRINSIRDDKGLSDVERRRLFKTYHGLSVLLFVLNFVLAVCVIYFQIAVLFKT